MLDVEKTVFAQNFVQRAEFTAKYQNALTAESFVEALIQSVQASGVDLSGERTNLVVISVLAQIITAAVIGLIIAAFFIVLGVITIDKVALVSWIGSNRPSIIATWTLAGHSYIISNEMLRVSAFLGAFTGFYFIVTSSTDATMRADLTAGHERHVRTCLAVRHAYWEIQRS